MNEMPDFDSPEWEAVLAAEGMTAQEAKQAWVEMNQATQQREREQVWAQGRAPRSGQTEYATMSEAEAKAINPNARVIDTWRGVDVWGVPTGDGNHIISKGQTTWQDGDVSKIGGWGDDSYQRTPAPYDEPAAREYVPPATMDEPRSHKAADYAKTISPPPSVSSRPGMAQMYQDAGPGPSSRKKTYLPIPAQMEPPPPMRPWEGAEMQDQETLYRRPRWRGAEMQDQAPLYQPPRREIFPWDVDKYRQQGIAPYDLWR
jgi:hypothetical protein